MEPAQAESSEGMVVLWDGEAHALARCPSGRSHLASALEFAEATGWDLRPEGLCNGDVCVPVRDRDSAEPEPGFIDLEVVAPLLDRPVVVDGVSGVVSIGATRRARSEALIERRAPSFRLPGLDGDVHCFEDLRGRLTVLVTFSSWCGCRYDLPGWQALADELADEGLSIIAVAFDQDAEVVRPFAEGITIPVLYDPFHQLAELYAISNVPTVIWIDETGRVVRPNTPAFGTDLFTDFHGVPAGPHLDAIRDWVRNGHIVESRSGAVSELNDDEIDARLWFRIGAYLHRNGQDRLAETAFARASSLAPLDFTVARAAMPLTGRDPFGEEFLSLYAAWEEAGKPFHGLDPDLGDC